MPVFQALFVLAVDGKAMQEEKTDLTLEQVPEQTPEAIADKKRRKSLLKRLFRISRREKRKTGRGYTKSKGDGERKEKRKRKIAKMSRRRNRKQC